MTEPCHLNRVIDRKTKRKRWINSTASQEIVKSKLTDVTFEKPKVIYEDDDPVKLKEVRSKLKATDTTSYTIRGNKIYECRKKQKKIDVIRATVRHTLQILQDRELLEDGIDALQTMVLNELFDGSNKTTYKIL